MRGPFVHFLLRNIYNFGSQYLTTVVQNEKYKRKVKKRIHYWIESMNLHIKTLVLNKDKIWFKTKLLI